VATAKLATSWQLGGTGERGAENELGVGRVPVNGLRCNPTAQASDKLHNSDYFRKLKFASIFNQISQPGSIMFVRLIFLAFSKVQDPIILPILLYETLTHSQFFTYIRSKFNYIMFILNRNIDEFTVKERLNTDEIRKLTCS